MNLDYAEIFTVRGRLYHRAMARAPEARVHEFRRLFDARPVRPGETLLDLPAGGGYLRAHIPAGANLTARELTPGFSESTEVLGESNWNLGRFDHVVCLAALHHIHDARAFLMRLCGHVLPGGTLHLADVGAASNLVAFLDGFVGRYNETGHEGRYLAAEALPLDRSQCTVSRVENLPCPWEFTDDDQMLAFCNDLFGLVNCPRNALLDALEGIVGVERSATSTLLRWHLTYVDIHPL